MSISHGYARMNYIHSSEIGLRVWECFCLEKGPFTEANNNILSSLGKIRRILNR